MKLHSKHLVAISGIALMALFLTVSCSKKTAVVDAEFSRYIAAFTYGNISPESAIEVELTQELPAVELNAEVKEKLFSFSPGVKGTAVWVNNHTVRFVPEAGALKPGKKYEVKFHLNKVLRVEGKFKTFKFPIRINEQNFTVNVLPYSPMTLTDLTRNTVEIEINTANATTSEQVSDMINTGNLPADVAVRVVPGDKHSAHRVFIDNVPRTEREERYEITINGKPLGVNRSVKASIDMPPLSKTSFFVIDARLDQRTTPYIRVTFSDPLAQGQDIQGLIFPAGVNNFTFQTEKNVLRIYPETLPEGSIKLQINEGLKNRDGLPLDKSYSYDLSVESSKPEIRFESKGNILPNAEQLNLPFSAVNLWAVDVRVVKIFKNNIPYYLQSNTLGSDYQSEIRRFGRVVMHKQVRLDKDKSIDLSKWNRFFIDLSTLFEQDPGAMYIVRLSMKQEYSLYPCGGTQPRVPSASTMIFNQLTEEEEERWDIPESEYYDPIAWDEYDWEDRDDPCTPSYYMSSDRRIETVVAASNLGIIAKNGRSGQMLVAVTDILTAKPVSGAKVTVFSYQMQPLGQGTTNGDGFADIALGRAKPFVVTVSKGKDTGYLEVKDEVALSLSSFEVSGKEIQKGLKGYLYGERGVWRPGDSIFLTFVLEDKINKLPKGHPVTLEVFTPKRQFYLRRVKTEHQNGFYTFALATPPTAETGTWQAYVKVGGTSFYKGLRIETIKPNRLKVRLETDSIIYASEGSFAGTLTSEWLHGAAASNLKAEVELTLSKTENPFGKYADYTFNNPLVNFETTPYKVFDGLLNASGTAGIHARVPSAQTAPGMLRGTILSRVYETGGDMSFYTQTVLYSPYEAYVGVKSPTQRQQQWLETDKPIDFHTVAVSPAGKKITRSLEYKIYKLNWVWWWNSTDESLGSFVNNTAVRPVASGSVAASSPIRFEVKYPDWGRYLLLVKDPTGGHTSGTVFYVDWPSWRGRSQKTDPSGLAMLAFTTDKPSYAVGEKATVIIPKSSDGQALISLENGTGVLHREWVAVSAEQDTKYTFTVTEAMNPNVYVFATLIQPHAQTANDLPIRMYGVVNIDVEDKESHLTPIITMPDELRPEKEFVVNISEKSKKPMTYTLAIVDEGLLDLTAFKTPNAWNEFYAREALGVRTWDLFDRVLGTQTGLMGTLLSIGGDEEALKASGDRANRFKPVVKFIGPFTIKKGETKAHKIKLPPYVGSVRVMVVAGKEGAYGKAEKTVPVRNALMTLSTLPRVLGPGEEVALPVNVFVMDNKVKNVNVTVAPKGLLQVVEGATQSLSFARSGDKIVYFKLKAGKKTGEEQITIKASGGGETFTETINIGIRNPNPPVTLTQTALIEPGKTATIALAIDQIGAHDWAKLELSRMPSIHFAKNLDFLLDYPHACSEQLTSQGFPLLYIGEFIPLSDEQKKQYAEKTAEIIRILSSRQLADGGFMYWSGANRASEWVTSYVGHFLLEAKNKGYDVSEYVVNRWIQFQQKLARNWSATEAYSHYYAFSMSDLQQAYRLYTLALADKTELGAMNRLREHPDLSLQARWSLAAAYASAGRKDAANELIFNSSNAVEDYSFNNDTYGSPARDQAMMMNTYLLLGQTEKALELAPSVARALSGTYISTQTAAFGLVAMQKLAQKMGKGNIDASWTLNGKTMPTINTAQPLHQTAVDPAQKMAVHLTNRGTAKLYARLTARTQPTETTDAPAVTDAPFRLNVRYTDASGNPVNVAALKQGTEFRAVVTVENGVEQPFSDLALVQIFPSGWEIINERLMLPDNAASGATHYDYRDIRDDRVLTYFNLAAGQSKSFSVRLQAAYRGVFYLPPVSCQAMYAPEKQARTTGVWVRVGEQ